MDSSVSPKDEIWFLRVCRHISNAVYRQWRRNRPFISIFYSLRNGQHLFILADKDSEMETLSLSFRSPSRNKRCVINLCLTDRITALAADIPHWSVMWTFRCCRCGFHCGLRPNELTDNNRPTRDVESVADISYCAEVTKTLRGPRNKSLTNHSQKSVATRTRVVLHINCTHGIPSII